MSFALPEIVGISGSLLNYQSLTSVFYFTALFVFPKPKVISCLEREEVPWIQGSPQFKDDSRDVLPGKYTVRGVPKEEKFSLVRTFPKG